MKEIGEYLKQKRLEKGITIDQIVEKTRMSAIRIKAIEEGDLSAFKDDITYLQFFIQSYCNAIGIDFHEVKDQLNESINSYTMSFKADQIRQQNEIEKNIREKSNQRINDYKIKNKPKKVARKIDFSLISFVSVIAVILICLLTVGGYYISQRLNAPNDTPIVDVPDDQPQDKPEPDKPDPIVEVKEIEVKPTELVSDFIIENAKEKFIVKIEFASNSWLNVTLDGKALSTPAPKVYDSGTILEFELDPEKNETLSFHFGYFAGLKLYVDDKEVKFDESIAKKPNVQDINLKIGGTTNESAE